MHTKIVIGVDRVILEPAGEESGVGCVSLRCNVTSNCKASKILSTAIMRRFRLYLDENMPVVTDAELDVVHTHDIVNRGERDLVALNRATKLKRAFVTHDRGFLRAGAVPAKHSGVVVVQPATANAKDLARNLRRLRSCLLHCLEPSSVANQVLILEIEQGIACKHPDGYCHVLHEWD